jgi:hypothetical protein
MRTLIFFAHNDVFDTVDRRIQYYLEQLRELGDIVFVSSGQLNPEAAANIWPLCKGVYCHKGDAWHHGWWLAVQNGWLDDYDRVVFADDSVYGPLYPLTQMWDSFTGADVYTAAENTSFFVAVELNERTLSFLNVNDEGNIIGNALVVGLHVEPYLSAEKAHAAIQQSPAAPWSDGTDDDPTVAYWDILVEYVKFPFIKTEVIHQPNGFLGPWHAPERWRNVTWEGSMQYLQRLLTNISYPFELIAGNTKRLGYDTYAANTPTPNMILASSYGILGKILERPNLSDADRAKAEELVRETDHAAEKLGTNPTDTAVNVFVLRMNSVFQQTRALAISD